jgi:hypothetical protein
MAQLLKASPHEARWLDMNYTQLFNNIQSYTENNFPEFTVSDGAIETPKEQIDRFIQQAEQRVYNTVQFPFLRKNMTGNVQSGNKYLQAPNDYLATYSLATIGADGSYEYLLNKDVNYIRAAYPNPTTDVGAPKYYALFGPAIVGNAITNELTFLLGPTPDAVYTMELHFYYYPESITTAGTSWLGDNFDTVLLYGALVEAYTYMKGETDLLAVYDGKYKEALAQAKRLGDGMERQDAYRSGQYRQAVT